MAREEFNMPLKISRWEVIDELAMINGTVSFAEGKNRNRNPRACQTGSF